MTQSTWQQLSKKVSKSRLVSVGFPTQHLTDVCTWTKLDAIVQLRPHFKHLDAQHEARAEAKRLQVRAERPDNRDHVDPEPEVRAVNMAVKSTEANEEDMYGTMRTTAKLLRDMRDEPWQRLDWVDQDVSSRNNDCAALSQRVSGSRVVQHLQRGLGIPRPRQRASTGLRNDQRAIPRYHQLSSHRPNPTGSKSPSARRRLLPRVRRRRHKDRNRRRRHRRRRRRRPRPRI